MYAVEINGAAPLPKQFIKTILIIESGLQVPAPSARVKINAKLILWADAIFVMEKRHKQIITERFATEVIEKELVILDIPDDYEYMDEELIEQIQSKMTAYL